MATAKAVALNGSLGEQAYERVRPLIEKAKKNVTEALIAIGSEYAALPDAEKDVFCKRLGWSMNRVAEFATAAKRLPNIQKILGHERSCRIEDFDMQHIVELGRTPEKMIRLAADAGMFDKPVTQRDIITLRKTGRIPEDKPKAKPQTDLQKIRALMVDAEGHMTRAALAVGKIVTIMYDSGITDAKGKEATALIQAFEKLCTEMASANPTTSKRAFAILRGEA